MSRRAQSKVETALNARGIRFIGGYRTRTGNVSYYNRGHNYRLNPGYGRNEALRRYYRMALL